MTQALLTILVPTYNRAGFVERLLGVLERDLANLPQVRVVVGDNASTDDTPKVTQAYQRRRPGWLFLRHASNLGPDENFCRCLERVQTPYFWIVGDDDLPREGVIRRVVQLLQEQRPDLLYLSSEWRPDVSGDRGWTFASTLSVQARDRENFAAAINVWVTFISGMVVNSDTLRAASPTGLALRRYTGTNLVQLGWVLPVLMAGQRFLTVREPWILATHENTGGYKLLTVFGRNLVEVVESACGVGSVAAGHILRAQLWNYLPGLIWSVRCKGTQAFQGESVLDALTPLRRFAAYRWLLVPLYRLPLPLAKLLMLVPRIYGKWLRVRYG